MSEETSPEILIVGAGLAGACAAMWLSTSHDVLVLDTMGAGFGASATTAGLVSPLMSKRARPVWRMSEAMDALRDTLELARASSQFRQTGVLRSAADRVQADAFQRVAGELPAESIWMESNEVADRFPEVSAPHGALFAMRGGCMNVPAFVGSMLHVAERNGARSRIGPRVNGWTERSVGVEVLIEEAGANFVCVASMLILCLGAGYAAFSSLRRLRLHLVKGQTLSVAKPGTGFAIPPVVGPGYAIPQEKSVVLGSTFQHQFETLAPEPERSREILARVEPMIPSLRGAPVLDEWAGIRTTVPGIRLPMLGPLPDHKRVWVFTGLGSKGLLMAPLVARDLQRYMADPDTIPPEIRVR